MKKFITIILALVLLVSCAAPRMIQVGNITLRDRKGEVVSYYEKARIVNQVGEGDQVTNIRFVTRDGVEHYIEDGYISVDGIEYVQERNNHTYVVVNSYPYWYYRSYPYVVTYPYHPYYNRRPYYYRPAPPRPQPAPRPAPRPSNRPRR